MESFLGSQWLGWLLRTLVRLCQSIVDTAHSLLTQIYKEGMDGLEPPTDVAGGPHGL